MPLSKNISKESFNISNKKVLKNTAKPKKDSQKKILTKKETLITSSNDDKEKNNSDDKEKNNSKDNLNFVNNFKSNKEKNMPTAASNNKKENFSKRPINLYRKIALSFVLATVILIVVIFYFSFVNLTIVLIPSQERISDSLIFDVYDENLKEESFLENNSVKGIVEQIKIKESKIYLSTDTEIIGEEVSGKVIIINNYNKNQPLVATTRLLSPDNKLFRIKETVSVPAGGSVEAEVYADDPSEAMAIGPTRFTIPGLWAGLQEKIYAESKIKFNYGKQVKKYIKQSDIDKAVKDLKGVLIKEAEKKFGDNYKGHDKVIYNIDENSVSAEVDGKVGEEKEKFKVNIEALVTIVAFSKEQAGNLARNKLLTIIPSSKNLIDFDINNILFNLNNLDFNNGLATIKSSFDGKMMLTDNADIIDRHKIVGLTENQLKDYLDNFQEIAGYDLIFRPSFKKKVPNLADRIKIEIKK